MTAHRHAKACRISYERRDGRAGTIEYLHEDNEWTFRGTARNHATPKGPSFWRKVKGWGALIRDIVADIRIMPRYHRELGWRPGGFRDATLAVVDEMVPHITKDMPIVLRGHSFGAIVAILAGEVLCRRGYWVHRVWAFAPPRAGKLKYLKPDHIRAFRFGKDIVTEVPPMWARTVECRRIGIPHGALEDHSIEQYEAWLKRYQ